MESFSCSQDLFTCPVCLDLLIDPVTILCGHTFCMDCIMGCWEDENEVNRCPQCRQTFFPRPDLLHKNKIVAELVEQIRMTRTGHNTPICFAGPGDVECDVCVGRKKYKAAKSCLECVASYCEFHLKTHNESHSAKDGSVIEATHNLQERTCLQHKALMEIFCRTDQTCICQLCTMGEHNGHETITAGAARKDKQKQLGGTQTQIQQRIQETEKEIQTLKDAVNNLKSSAQTAVDNSERIFGEVIRTIKERGFAVTQLIRSQERAQVSPAEELLEKLELEVAELKKRDAELEELVNTQDDILFLKNMQSLGEPPASTESLSSDISLDVSFEGVTQSVASMRTQLEEKLDEIFKQKKINISTPVVADQAALPQPVNREDFLQYYCYLTVDPNTVHPELVLTEGNRRVKLGDPQPYPDHPDRFDGFSFQVMCREGVCGRYYWEVEWNGEVTIAMSYRSIYRKGIGDECAFGYNEQSWRLEVSSSKSTFMHNREMVDLPLVANSIIGVFVDDRAGILAFYSVSDTMTLLHSVQTTFKHTLYPGFGIGGLSLEPGSSVKLL